MAKSNVTSPQHVPVGARSVGPKDWLLAAALAAAVLTAYQPAWQGGQIWDDDAHVTRPGLRGWDGLWRIWSDPSATQQYYPLLHSAFWLEHRLWGDAATGYHLMNILQHIAAALMVWLVLRRLAIPGAYLAAAIFALHPVHAESVAWITEQKNTLSAVFYLGAALAYLRFDRTRGKPFYLLALGLFVLGLLSKTVTATLPAALLVVFWWQRGRLSWRRDVLPLLPLFLLGAAAGLATAWVERKLIGAEGAEFDLAVAQRFLLAGRVVWFYLGKLVWPADLLFIYPRWQMDSAAWSQYVYPAASLTLLAALWLLRRRTRAPLAALLFFAGTLFPVLGFFNVFPFIYSYVADHFQYLASLGVITLAAAGAAILTSRIAAGDPPARFPRRRAACQAAALGLLIVLAGLTWRQSRMYADAETLYRTTISANPDCWMAYNNLATIMLNKKQFGEARKYLDKALELRPDYAEAHSNLGLLLVDSGEHEAGMAEYEKSLKLAPRYAVAGLNLGVDLQHLGRIEEATAAYKRALEINPGLSRAWNNLGVIAESRGDLDEAIADYGKALGVQPDYADAHYNLGMALAGRGRWDEAINHRRRAVQLQPDNAVFHNSLGGVLASRGRLNEAIAEFEKALQIQPGQADARQNLQMARQERQRLQEGLADRRAQLRSRPDDTGLLNNLAWALATNPDASLRDGAEAVELAQRAATLTDRREPAVLDTLAAAYAESGRFPEAVETARQAVTLAVSQDNRALAKALEARIGLYQARLPYRDVPMPASGAP